MLLCYHLRCKGHMQSRVPPCGGVYLVLNSENFQLNQKVGTGKTFGEDERRGVENMDMKWQQV